MQRRKLYAIILLSHLTYIVYLFFRVLRGFLWLSYGDLKKIRIPVKIHVTSVLFVSHEDFLRWHWLANLSHPPLLDVCECKKFHRITLKWRGGRKPSSDESVDMSCMHVAAIYRLAER